MTEETHQQEADTVEAEAVEVEAETVDTAEAEAPPPPQWSDEDAEEARIFGWKSPDEWQGEKPAGYIDDPKRFLERVQGSRVFKAMQERIDRQEREQAESKERLERMNQRALERQREQYETRLADIRSRRDRAAEDGDLDAYKTLARQEQDMLDKRPDEPKTETKPERPPVDPEVQAYRESEAGQWLGNPILAQTASDLIDANPAMMARPAKDQIAYVEGEIRKMYPAYFPSAAKPQHRQVVDGGGLAGGGGAAPRSAFAKLPGEAKAQFERFVKEGIFENTKDDREEYARDYGA